MSFDVTADGEVTNVIAALAGAVISIGLRFRVDEAGRWEASASGPGVRARIHGEVDGAEVAGVLEVTSSGGDTRSAAWRARRIPSLAF